MKKTRLTIILLMILTLVSAIITLCMGAVRIPVQDTLSILLRHLFGTDTGTSVSVAFEQIVWQIRMPRIILGFLAGSGLALCGCVMQEWAFAARLGRQLAKSKVEIHIFLVCRQAQPWEPPVHSF